jgi:ribosome-interacting GTPase 1
VHRFRDSRPPDLGDAHAGWFILAVGAPPMPANLPPIYHEAEARYRAAKAIEDKIAALQEMLRVIPKHKGTDKLQADLKSRLAKLRRQPKKKSGARGFSHHIPKEGAGQIALLGPPNGGKSSLVDRLTHASPQVADYPFSTREPLPGMMPFEDVAFQLIDLPPLSDEYTEPWVFDLARGADLAWIVVEGSDSLDGLGRCERLLAAKRIGLCPADASLPETVEIGWTWKPALLVVTGRDLPGSAENLQILKELLERPWPTLAVSSADGAGLDELRRATFEALDIIRIYTKQPGKPPDRKQPFTLPRGSTVSDLAAAIHKDLLDQLKFARVWGSNVFDGQTVQRDHALEDGDVIEIHA